MEHIIGIAIGYLIGTINTAYLFGKHKGIDIKAQGTKNAGASNATIVMGWKVGIMVAVVDVLKAVVSITIIRLLFPLLPTVAYVTGIATIIGHIFPFYMNFNGGKGFASYLGMILALNWRIFLVLLLLAIIVTILTDYIALATLITAVVYPIYSFYEGLDRSITMLFGLLSVIIIYKHWGNIKRIMNGTEVGLRKVGKSKI